MRCWAVLRPWTLPSGVSAAAPAEWANQSQACPHTHRVQGAAAQALSLPPFAGRQHWGCSVWASWRAILPEGWNKINVMVLPHFPVQKQKGDRFLRNPVTCSHFNSTGWFPSGLLGNPSPTAQDSLQNPESWFLIQQPRAIDLNLVICKKVGWNFVVVLIHLPLEMCSLHSKSGLRFIIWHRGNCQDIFWLSARYHCRRECEPQLLLGTHLQL